MNKNYYTCMGCGFSVFSEVFSEYEICPICGFQDSVGGINKPFISQYIGDNNNLISIQKNILKKISMNIKEYKVNDIIFYRNPLWNPINELRFNKKFDYYPSWKFKEFKEKYPKYINYHYELMINAQKNNPDNKVHLL